MMAGVPTFSMPISVPADIIYLMSYTLRSRTSNKTYKLRFLKFQENPPTFNANYIAN
jgi:hypothetical protein